MKKNVFWKILIHFIIYSIVGFFLETIYAIFTKGVLESRKSFLYGPFCIVYGIGAIVLIMLLEKHKKNNIKLFAYGAIYGAIVEYFTSYIAECFLHVKWWDYSGAFLNVHGRTCLYYAVCWGILSIPLIKYINPAIDNLIEKLFDKKYYKVLKVLTSCTIVFMFFNGIISCYAIDSFLTRVSNEYDLNISGIDYESNIQFENKLFSNEKMMMTYPNLLVVNDNNEIIGLQNILKDVKNYYYSFVDK